MKHLILLTLIASCATPIAKPVATDTQYQIPGLTEQKQETELWCAAAASRMLMSQKGTTPRQCEIASKVHKLDCCNKTSVKCESEVLVETALPAFGLTPLIDNSPTFAEVVGLVKSGKPVAIYHYNRAGTMDGSAHAVVAYWVYDNDSKIAVYDPYTGSVKFWDATYQTGNLAWYRIAWVK